MYKGIFTTVMIDLELLSVKVLVSLLLVMCHVS